MQHDDAEPTSKPAKGERPRTITRAFRELATWKKVLFGLALALFVGGIVVGLIVGGGEADGGAGSGAGLGSSLVGDGQASTGAEADGDGSVLKRYAPGAVKVGFGFVAGLSLGLFLRNFLRLTLTFVGLVLLAVLGLEYAGFVEVHWDALGDGFESLAAGIGDQFESFKTFVTGRIPAAGSALAGLWAGFRRR